MVVVEAGDERLGRRAAVVVVDWQNVTGLTPSGLAMPGQGVSSMFSLGMSFWGVVGVAAAESMSDPSGRIWNRASNRPLHTSCNSQTQPE